MSATNGVGSAGPPPGNPSGSVLNFGRYLGWSLGEISRSDIEYIEWLDRTPIGRIYQVELDDLLRSHGRRVTHGRAAGDRRGGCSAAAEAISLVAIGGATSTHPGIPFVSGRPTTPPVAGGC